MNDLLASTDFVYDIALRNFDRCVTVADSVSPGTQANQQTSSLSTAKYALYSNRVISVDSFASTPVVGENQDSQTLLI